MGERQRRMTIHSAGAVVGVHHENDLETVGLIGRAGVFACILAMKRSGQMIETIADLSGLARTQPRLALARRGQLNKITPRATAPVVNRRKPSLISSKV